MGGSLCYLDLGHGLNFTMVVIGRASSKRIGGKPSCPNGTSWLGLHDRKSFSEVALWEGEISVIHLHERTRRRQCALAVRISARQQPIKVEFGRLNLGSIELGRFRMNQPEPHVLTHEDWEVLLDQLASTA